MINNELARELEQTAWQIRLELIKMFSYGKAHHFGGSLSCVEILTSLYFYRMNYSKDNANDLRRDRFLMSKGHSIPTQYVVLAKLGIIPMEELKTIKKLGTRLQGHPDVLKTPGIEAPTGSLGMGLSYANGIALAARLDGTSFNIFLLLGDGELQEGQVWEAAMTTSHYNLNNICAVVDRNRFQSQGEVDCLKTISPLSEKWRSFGWRVYQVDGHSIKQLCNALDCLDENNKSPLVIIANTVKGKGVKFLENTCKYHNYSLSKEEYDQAIREIQTQINAF
jgi:transketolase